MTTTFQANTDKRKLNPRIYALGSILFALSASFMTSAQATNIKAGYELLRTVNGTTFDFGPGIGVQELVGNPIETFQGKNVKNADTIIQFSNANNTGFVYPINFHPGESITVNISLAALSLKTSNAVNINGTDYNIYVTLDTAPAKDNSGTATIFHQATIDNNNINIGHFYVGEAPVAAYYPDGSPVTSPNPPIDSNPNPYVPPTPKNLTANFIVSFEPVGGGLSIPDQYLTEELHGSGLWARYGTPALLNGSFVNFDDFLYIPGSTDFTTLDTLSISFASAGSKVHNVVHVPEPVSLALFAIGGLGLFRFKPSSLNHASS